MAVRILPTLRHFPKEEQIIGRLVVGYGELEFLFHCCVGAALQDEDAAFRALFRIRGEATRIDVGDALMRQQYSATKLRDRYNEMIGAMRFCKTVRNQYAHAHWRGDKDGWVSFAALEQAAKSHAGTPTIAFTPIKLPVLTQQEEYFVYTAQTLQHLWPEYEHLTGQKLTGPRRPEPTIIPQPPLDSRPPTRGTR
jgi:hypothetical protein